MAQKKEYVPNKVFKFVCYLDNEFCKFEKTIYTTPFSDDKTLNERIDIVKQHYFTQEKIKELKEELINKIKNSKNPFDIFCSDVDSGYNVTEEQLFKFNKNK